MIIYGVAILAFCFLVGKLMGSLLGTWIGISGDVGGVGFAMLLLMLSNLYLKKKAGSPNKPNKEFFSGVRCTFPSS